MFLLGTLSVMLVQNVNVSTVESGKIRIYLPTVFTTCLKVTFGI